MSPGPDALAAARSALRFLHTGQTAEARAALEALPNLLARDIRAKAQSAYLRGLGDGRREAKGWGPLPQRQARPDCGQREQLRALLSDPAKRAAVRELLRLDDRLLERIADGSLALSPTPRRKLRAHTS